MKVFFTLTTLLLSFQASAQNLCPVGFEKAQANTRLKGLSSEYIFIMNNEAPIQGDGTFEGSSTFTNNGLLRLNYKRKLSTEDVIEAHTQIKLLGSSRFDIETCGLLPGQCLLVDHPQIKSIQIDSKKDEKVKDLRVVGIEVCKETSSNLAKRNVVDTDRSIAGSKSDGPEFKSNPTYSDTSSAQ